MNFFLFATISAFSIIGPSTIGLYRCNKISKLYWPFIVLLCIGLGNESLSYIMIKIYQNNLINANCYTLIEYGLYVWFFNRIQEQKRKWIFFIWIAGISIWILDNVVLHQIDQGNALFRIFAALVIIWLSINKVTQLILNGAADRFKKPDLLLCFSLLVYFTFKGFILLFKQFSLGHPTTYYIHLWVILGVLNIFVNLAFMIALLWIPKHQQHTSYY